MSEFIHVHLIEKQPVGANLGRHIPLHMTVLHWFESERDAQEIVEVTKASLSNLKHIDVAATSEDLFGPNSDIPVMRLEKSPPLLNLHMVLKQAMEEMGAKFDSKWTGELNWNPHVTHKGDSRLNLEDHVHIGDVDLITRDNKSGDRTIIRRFKLGSE